MSIVSNLRIVVVDDDLDHLTLLRHILKEADPEVGVAQFSDSSAFLEEISNCHSVDNSIPRLIVLDLKMNRVSGLDIVRKLRSIPAFAPTHVVMFSSSSAEKDAASAYAGGVDSYICKPTDIHEYRAIAKRLTKINRS